MSGRHRVNDRIAGTIGRAAEHVPVKIDGVLYEHSVQLPSGQRIPVNMEDIVVKCADLHAALHLIDECISDLGDEQQPLDRLAQASRWESRR